MSRTAQLLDQVQDMRVLTLPRPVPVAAPTNQLSPGEEIGPSHYLALAQRLFLAEGAGEAPRSLLFCPVERSNRLAPVSALVAKALAAIGEFTHCLVDANLWSPSLHQFLACDNRCGLSDFLRRPTDLRSLVQRLEPSGIWFLPSGTSAPDADAPARYDRLSLCLHGLRSQFDRLLIQAPPLARNDDALRMARLTNGVVLVLEAGVSLREDAVRAKLDFDAAGVQVLGAVLTGYSSPTPRLLDRVCSLFGV